jgi:hypothetical protein
LVKRLCLRIAAARPSRGRECLHACVLAKGPNAFAVACATSLPALEVPA